MKKINLKLLTIEKAAEDLRSGEFSARELAENYLENISEKNDDIFAYLEVYDDVLAQADEADKKIKSGTATILTGIPLAVKDNILIEGRKASGGSKILENYRATYDASIIKKLKEEGVVFLGRTNMDEFAMGGSTENSAYGVTKNPFDLKRVAGGSSGGSAAAVAMDGALLALGSDTGGSIRQPASFCGVVGLKTTYGSVSRHGLMAMGSSLDQIGPFGKTVRDAEILFNALSFNDPMDSTSLPKNMREISRGENNKKIGVPFDFIERDGIDKEVLENFKDTLKKMEKHGYEIIPVSLPNISYALSVYYVLMPAEVSSNMARYDGVRYGLSVEGNSHADSFSKTRAVGFGAEVRRRIMLGTYVLSHGYYDAFYGKANMVREKIKAEFAETFKKVSCIATPTSPTPAFLVGEKSQDPLSMYLADIFTVPANIAGIPSISVPSGKTHSGLPLGIQFTASYLREDILFSAGKDIEGII